MKKLWSQLKDWYFQEWERSFDTRWFYLRVVKEITWRHKSRSERFREVYWRTYLNLGGDDDARYEGNLPKFENQTLWGGRHCFVRLEIDPNGDRLATLGFGIPGFATWFGFDHRPTNKKTWNWFWNRYLGDNNDRGFYRGEGRDTSISVHGGSIWWSVWMPNHSGKSQEPWWRRGNFGLDDVATFLLGRERHSEKVLSETVRVLELPEGSYPVTVQVIKHQKHRSRWPWPTKTWHRVDMDTKTNPIPIPGKWSDKDATYSMSVGGTDIDQAMADFHADILATREKRGGKDWLPEVSHV